MIRRLAWLSLVLATGCRERTEIMLGVATDLKAKGQIDLVQLTVERNGVPIIQAPPWDLSDLPAGRFELPGSFGLFANDGSEPRFDVSVKGFRNNVLVTERNAILSLVSGKTLFVRMGLVGACDPLNRPTCGPTEVCVEGVCREKEINKKRLPLYVKDLVDHWACRSGTNWIFSGSGNAMPPLDDGMCDANQYCEEGTCFNFIDAEDGALQQGLWVQQPTSSTFVLHALWGTSDGRHVFAVGEGGTILHKADGGPMAGSGWLPEGSGTRQPLWGIWGSSADDVWAVGSGGVILHRTQGRWAQEPAVEGVLKLEAVWGAGGIVWAVGRTAEGGVVLRRAATGGWTVQERVPAPLVSLWGSGANDLWAVGPAGNLLRGDGATWRAFEATLDGEPLYSVGGTAANEVYLVGRDGLVLKWDGAQLVRQEAATRADLFAVWATTRGDVYVAGDHGVILHSRGDGLFTEEPSGTRQPLFALWASSPEDIYTSGRDGIVLHSTGMAVPAEDLSMPVVDTDASGPLDMRQPPDMTPVVYVNAHHHMPDGGFWLDFEPNLVDIPLGTSVIWRWGNADGGTSDTHSVTSCDQPGSCDQRIANGHFCHSYTGPSPSPGPAACMPVIPSLGPYTYSHRFTTPGTYTYFCIQHGSDYGTPTKHGQVIVR